MAYKYKLVQEISKDPLGAKIQDLKPRFEKELGIKPNPNVKNTFKTPEELGKANLAKEVLNKLRNR